MGDSPAKARILARGSAGCVGWNLTPYSCFALCGLPPWNTVEWGEWLAEGQSRGVGRLPEVRHAMLVDHRRDRVKVGESENPLPLLRTALARGTIPRVAAGCLERDWENSPPSGGKYRRADARG